MCPYLIHHERYGYSFRIISIPIRQVLVYQCTPNISPIRVDADVIMCSIPIIV